MWRALPLFFLLACGNKNNPAPVEEPAAEAEAPTDAAEPAEPVFAYCWKMSLSSL